VSGSSSTQRFPHRITTFAVAPNPAHYRQKGSSRLTPSPTEGVSRGAP
jgi:hypothetical protein